MTQMKPVEALERIAYLLERGGEPTYRVKAFRGAAAAIKELSDDELLRRTEANRLRELPGVGPKTEQVIREALAGEIPGYLRKLEEAAGEGDLGRGNDIRAALKGDCHTHSDWSDGGSPIEEMAETAPSPSSTPRPCSRRAPATTPPSRSTAVPNASTRRAGSSASPSTRDARPPSTPMPTPPASWSGRSTAAPGPQTATCPCSRSS